MDHLMQKELFETSVYIVKKPEFLDVVKRMTAKYTLTGDEVLSMSQSYFLDPEVKDFAEYVSQSAWNILESQGYAMDGLITYFTEMWTQTHWVNSYMETHVHGGGTQISAFYFIEAPADGCKLVIHDPRPGKVLVDLPEKDDKQITGGSRQIVFTPEPGALIFTNAWVPHSFTRNKSDEPVRFVHMNISVANAPAAEENLVEVV